MKVKKDSILDQFYMFLCNHKSPHTDICTYVRGIIRGMFVAILVAVGISGVIIFVIEPYIALALYLVTGSGGGFFEAEGVLAVGSTLIQSMLLLFYGFKYLIGLAKAHLHIKLPSTPSIISTRYKAFKEKTCYLVERV